MIYKKLKATDYPCFFEEYSKTPHLCRVSLLPDENGKIIVAKGRTSEIDGLPDNCVLIETQQIGGTLIGFSEFVCLVAFDTQAPYWMTKLVNYLKGRGIGARIDGNDVMADGYKIGGFASRKMDNSNLTYYSAGIPIDFDLSLVQQICKKPMKKIPRGLDAWGITRKDILTALDVEEE